MSVIYISVVVAVIAVLLLLFLLLFIIDLTWCFFLRSRKILIGFASRPRRTSKRSKRGISLDADAKQYDYDDVPDSNCDHEDIGEPVTKKSKV
jgi:hypothetical protein